MEMYISIHNLCSYFVDHLWNQLQPQIFLSMISVAKSTGLTRNLATLTLLPRGYFHNRWFI